MEYAVFWRRTEGGQEEITLNWENEIRLGQLVATNGIETEMDETYGFRDFCMHCLLRHRSRDWGDLGEEDKHQNDYAADHNERLLSAYRIPRFYCLGYADSIWIVTEADRSVTTILFPHEY